MEYDTPDEVIPMEDMTSKQSPPLSIPRKPLPPDSPYSPPNSPRTSVILPQTTIFDNTAPANTLLITPPRLNTVPISPETEFVHEDSLKTISLTSTSGPSNQDVPQPPTKSLIQTQYPRYTYRALHPIPEGGEITYERMTLSDDDFPMRPKSTGTFKANGSIGGRKGWWIMVLAILIIMTIVAVLVAVGLSRSMGV